MDPFHILVADDHAVVRDGIHAIIRAAEPAASVYVAGSLGETRSLLEQRPEISVALLDLGMPGMSLAALDCLHSDFPDVKVVILSATEATGVIQDAFRRGVSGYIPKSTTSTVILHAIRIVSEGGRYLPPQLLVESGQQPNQEPAFVPAGLSERQAAVLHLMTKGFSNKEIARQLSLCESTVKTHVANIMRWLNVNSRAKVIHAASRLGLISLDDLAPH